MNAADKMKAVEKMKAADQFEVLVQSNDDSNYLSLSRIHGTLFIFATSNSQAVTAANSDFITPETLGKMVIEGSEKYYTIDLDGTIVSTDATVNWLELTARFADGKRLAMALGKSYVLSLVEA